MEWAFLGMIITLIVVGYIRSTQDYIDEQNERYSNDCFKFYCIVTFFGLIIGGSESEYVWCHGPSCHEI
jgi:hypothetical protein